MLFKEINNSFKVDIIDNKINNKFFKDLTEHKQKLMNELSITNISSKLTFHPEKIKQVDKVKYKDLKIYEYKIVLDKSNHVRMAFSVDYEHHKIYVLALVTISNKIRKVTFDHMVANLYSK